MASEVEICNAALQKLGAQRITALTDNSVNARACNAAYARLRVAELRKHSWNFAIARDALAVDATAPAFGRANSFTLPSAFLRLLPPYPEDNLSDRDWIIEGRAILTDESAPLYVRYIADVTDPNTMDPLFRDALAARMAWEMCEEITQSNTKRQLATADYNEAIAAAKRTNAIEMVPAKSPDDTWITVRN